MEEDPRQDRQSASAALLAAATACEGFSGRMLRKLPFLAHASCAALRSHGGGGGVPSCEAFAALLEAAARREAQDRGRMQDAAAGQ